MANPSSPSRAPRNAPQSKVHRYIDALFTDDFGRSSKLTANAAHGFAHKKLDTASQTLQVRNERNEKKGRLAEAREYRAAERGLQAELRETDRCIRQLWRALKTKVRPEKKVRHTPPGGRKRTWPYASVALPKYDGPVIDRGGQRGVFMRVRYYSRRTAEQGVSQRVVKYCFNGAEVDASGIPYAASNVGMEIDETLCAFDHLEQVNWSAAKNAKLLMHGIMAVDYRQTPDEMMRTGMRWAEETLGRFDLPYLVTLHAPPKDGDQRNWHLHILWSTRPLVRTGDHEWQVGEMLRTDLDNPVAMKLMREMYATVMTDVSFEAGQNQVYTAKSNAARGLPHEPQVHLGAADTNRARNGEHVQRNEDNHERVQRSKSVVLDDKLRHADEALAKQQEAARAIAARWAKLPALPMRVPEGVVAATISVSLPSIGELPSRPRASIVIPASVPLLSAEPALIADALRLSVVPPRALRRPSAEYVAPAIAAPPATSARPAAIETANLRFRAVPSSRAVFARATGLPLKRVAVTLAELPPLQTSAKARAENIAVPPILPRVATKVVIPAMHVLSVQTSARSNIASRVPSVPPRQTAISVSIGRVALATSPSSMADISDIRLALQRVTAAERRDLKRRDSDREETARVRQRVADEAQQTEQQISRDRLFAKLIAERHYLNKSAGRHAVPSRLLAMFGLEDSDIADDVSQRRLDPIAERQAAELDAIIAYVGRSPDALVEESGHWSLGDAAPALDQAIMNAWRHDQTVQGALASAAATRDAIAEDSEPPTIRSSQGWRDARHLRQQAMADWDEAERLDDGGCIKAGHRLERPGQRPMATPSAVQGAIARGNGLGS